MNEGNDRMTESHTKLVICDHACDCTDAACEHKYVHEPDDYCNGPCDEINQDVLCIETTDPEE